MKTIAILFSLLLLNACFQLPQCETGDCENGTGTYINMLGEVSSGQWEDGKLNGEGSVTFTDDASYVGEFKDDQYHGQGTFTFADGRRYTGQFMEGQYHGRGKFIHQNGEVYEGNWEYGRYHGTGTYTFVTGDRYEGWFIEDHFFGDGEFIASNGDRYKGKFDGKTSYQGATILYYYPGLSVDDPIDESTPKDVICIWPSGEKYVGRFDYYKPHGKGIKYNAQGEVMHKGKWIEGEFAGE